MAEKQNEKMSEKQKQLVELAENLDSLIKDGKGAIKNADEITSLNNALEFPELYNATLNIKSNFIAGLVVALKLREQLAAALPKQE